MNSLSWFLYLADVLHTMSKFLIVTGVLSTAFSLLTMLPILDPKIVKETTRQWYYKYLKRTIPIYFLLICIGVLIPSKQTIYLIVGSEAGEAVVTSEEGREILNSIKEVIEIQIKKLKE